jgi:phenylacetate-CoA ligase
MPTLDRLKHIEVTDRLIRRLPGVYESARRTIANVDSLDRRGRAVWVEGRLAAILKRARRLPGYANAGKSLQLSDWPILEKQQLLGHETDYFTKSLLPRARAATAGTTGQPMRLARSPKGIAFEQAVFDAICAVAGIDLPGARVAVLRGDSIKSPSDYQAPFWIDEGSRRRIFSAHHLMPSTVKYYADALRSFAPDVLSCYPSSLATLLQILPNAPDVRIPAIFSSSEMLSRHTLAAAQQRFGAKVIDLYGHAERVVAAWSLNGGPWRFIPAYGYVELLPEREGLASIVATSLWDHGELFIRYRTGDLVSVPSHDPAVLHEIALGLAPFFGIEGRQSEFVQLGNGQRIIGLNHIPRGVEGAASVQLHHAEAGRVDIYVVPTERFGQDARVQLVANFRMKFPPNVEARLIMVARPVRERNGKAPLLLLHPVTSELMPLARPEPL